MDQLSHVWFGTVLQFLLDYHHHIVLLHVVSGAAWLHPCVVEALQKGDAQEE